MSHWQAEFFARIAVRIEAARLEGFRRDVIHLVDVLAAAVVWMFALPLTVCLHLLGFRRLTVLTGRIGHLAAEPDSFLKARGLGWVRNGHYFMLAPKRAVANMTLLGYWRQHIKVIEQPLLCWMIGAMSRWALMRHDMSHYVLRLGASQEIYRINAAWDGRPPLLRLTDEDIAWSDRMFMKLGLPQGAWFVCIHVREPGFSPKDEAAHSYRNGDPQAVIPAMDEVIRRGGWCVRMGDPSMTPIEEKPGVIDYAHHPLRSPRLDVLLSARTRFFLGNTSGLALVSSVFGVPCALANLAPLSVLAFRHTDIGIPKLVRSVRDRRILAFEEILGTPIGNYRYTQLYSEAGLEVIENTPEEIRDLTIEMLDRLDGRLTVDADAERRQRCFMALLRPGHYGYGAASRIGESFLSRHSDLLPSS